MRLFLPVRCTSATCSCRRVPICCLRSRTPRLILRDALAGDRELTRRYELVLQELAETTRLNETLGAPSARAMEKLFAVINAEEVRAPRRRRRRPISRTRFLTPARDSARQKLSLTKWRAARPFTSHALGFRACHERPRGCRAPPRSVMKSRRFSQYLPCLRPKG
jgi:hypothetical protein